MLQNVALPSTVITAKKPKKGRPTHQDNHLKERKFLKKREPAERQVGAAEQKQGGERAAELVL